MLDMGVTGDVYTCTCAQPIFGRIPHIFDYDTCRYFEQARGYADELCRYEVSRPIVGMLCGCPAAQDDAEFQKKLEDI